MPPHLNCFEHALSNAEYSRYKQNLLTFSCSSLCWSGWVSKLSCWYAVITEGLMVSVTLRWSWLSSRKESFGSNLKGDVTFNESPQLGVAVGKSTLLFLHFLMLLGPFSLHVNVTKTQSDTPYLYLIYSVHPLLENNHQDVLAIIRLSCILYKVEKSHPKAAYWCSCYMLRTLAKTSTEMEFDCIVIMHSKDNPIWKQVDNTQRSHTHLILRIL